MNKRPRDTFDYHNLLTFYQLLGAETPIKFDYMGNLSILA
jgi:hypothetical protein